MKKKIFIFGGIFLAALILYIVFATLVSNSKGYPLAVDTNVANFCYNMRGNKGNFCYWFNRIFTEVGNTYFVIFLVLVGLFYTKLDKRWICFFIGILLEVSLNAVFKGIYQRERPEEALRWMYESSTSFPSGHSTTAGMVYPFILYVFLTSDEKKCIKIPALLVSGFFLVLIPITRMVLGMHYFSDCMAGLALGTMCAMGMAILDTVLGYYHILNNGVIHFKKKNKEADV